jgi:hypothetical protein
MNDTVAYTAAAASAPEGLTNSEAAARLREHGPNAVAQSEACCFPVSPFPSSRICSKLL